ncbi:MAG: 2-amino-4-hydroxy-6-hydroxymethyldihydropteridine diphosphokinase [Saprospiraceae bacterium]|jgi:2-amino-4-hydroxy-6-hydroxymethyldihydropteridine diphosphokinase
MGNIHTAYLLTGSNLGDRFEKMTNAKERIHELAGTVLAFSNYYETAAWGKEDQPDFLNQAIKISTSLPPLDLLHILLEIEQSLGRKRDEKWDARTIDIDILMYDDIVLDSSELSIPHKHMHERNFTLIPLMEIAATIEHPVLKKSIETLYWESKDPLDVYQIDSL